MDENRSLDVLRMIVLALELVVDGRVTLQKSPSFEALVTQYGKAYGVTKDEVREVMSTPLSELFRTNTKTS